MSVVWLVAVPVTAARQPSPRLTGRLFPECDTLPGYQMPSRPSPSSSQMQRV